MPWISKPIPAVDPSKFWHRVALGKISDCWLWLGGLQHEYGRLRYRGRSYAAHRVAWRLTYGPIPEYFGICHHCDVPRCCNPTHLFLGTSAENQRDARAKGRPTGNGPGEKNGRAKLTDADIREIRAGYRRGASMVALMRRYGIGRVHIWAIANRRMWRHVA